MIYRISKKEFLFLISVTVYLSALLLELTVLEINDAVLTALQYIRYVCYLLAVIKIIVDWYNAKSVWRILIVAILVGITILNLRGNTYAFYLLMIIAAKDVDFRKIIRQACFVQGIGLIVVVAASEVGFIENYLYIQNNSRIRYGLGFIYTTTAPILFFFFMMCYIYLRKEKMRIYEFAVLEAINYWFYFMTDTRFSFYLSSIMLVYVFFMRYFWQNRKDIIRKNRWLILTPSACCVGALLLHICYNPENANWTALNTFFNGRLRLGWNAFHTYGVTIFGQNIQWIGGSKLAAAGDYNYVDCSYMQLLLECGIIFLILVIAAYTYMMFVGIRIKDFYLQTILLFIVIFSITEPRLMNLAFNPFPLLAASVWSLKKPELLNRKEPILVPQFKIQATQIKFKNRV